MRPPATSPTQGLSRRRFAALAGGLVAAAATPTAAHAAATPPQDRRRRSSGAVGTWAAVPTAVPASGVTTVEDVTVRQVVRTTVGGRDLRVRLSNDFGETPLHVGEVHVALADPEGALHDVLPRTDRRLTFSGRTSATVPAGAPLVSDPVPLRVPERCRLVISLHLPQATAVTTVNAFSYQQNVVAAGNVTGARRVTPTATMTQWWFLSGVSVVPRGRQGAAIVALGDSITNGAETTVNADRRWPDRLSERLLDIGHEDLGVLNLGVAGNRLLHDPNPPAGSPAQAYAAFFGQSALRRFDRDVLAQPGVEHVVVLLGVNDLGHPGTSAPLSETVTADDIIGAHRQLIARAHERGLRIHGGTITPFGGDTLGFYGERTAAARQVVNRWIRTSAEYDSVIDFDAALRDPADPERMRARYDSGDHLHPNDAGMQALADAVPLQLFA